MKKSRKLAARGYSAKSRATKKAMGIPDSHRIDRTMARTVLSFVENEGVFVLRKGRSLEGFLDLLAVTLDNEANEAAVRDAVSQRAKSVVKKADHKALRRRLDILKAEKSRCESTVPGKAEGS